MKRRLVLAPALGSQERGQHAQQRGPQAADAAVERRRRRQRPARS